MKRKEDRVVCENIDDIVDVMNFNARYLDKRITKLNKKVNGQAMAGLLIATALYLVFSDAIDNLNIKCSG